MGPRMVGAHTAVGAGIHTSCSPRSVALRLTWARSPQHTSPWTALSSKSSRVSRCASAGSSRAPTGSSSTARATSSRTGDTATRASTNATTDSSTLSTEPSSVRLIVPLTAWRVRTPTQHGYLTSAPAGTVAPGRQPPPSKQQLIELLSQQVEAARAAAKQQLSTRRAARPSSHQQHQAADASSSSSSQWLLPHLFPSAGSNSSAHWAVAAAVVQVAGPALTLVECELLLEVLLQAAPAKQQQLPVNGSTRPAPLNRQATSAAAAAAAGSITSSVQVAEQQLVQQLQLSTNEGKVLRLPQQPQVAGLLTAALSRHLVLCLSSQGTAAAGADAGSDGGALEAAEGTPGGDVPAAAAAGGAAPAGTVGTINSAAAGVEAGRVLRLLQQLQQLTRSFGPVDQQLVGSWLPAQQLQQLELDQLGDLLELCQQLEQLLKASWLRACLEAAVSALRGGSSWAGGTGPSSATKRLNARGVTDAGDVAVAAARVLVGLGHYPLPGSREVNSQYRALAECVLSRASLVPPAVMAQLLPAIHVLQFAQPQDSRPPPPQQQQHREQQQEQQQQQRWYAATASSLLVQPNWADLAGCLQALASLGWAVQSTAVQSLCLTVSRELSGYSPRLTGAPAAAVATAAGHVPDVGAGSGALGPAGAARQELQPEQEQQADQRRQQQQADQQQLDWQLVPAGGQQVVPSAGQLLTLLEALEELGVEVEPNWLGHMLQGCFRAAPLKQLPRLLHAAARVLPEPPQLTALNKQLVKAMFDQVTGIFPVASSAQLADIIEALAAFGVNLGTEYVAWHASACQRVGKTFNLDDLVRVQDAYAALQYLPTGPLKMLMNTVPWRLRLRRQKQKAAAQAAAAIRVRKQAQRQRLAARRQRQLLRAKRTRKHERLKKMLEKEWQGPAGTGAASGRANWWGRKMKPPGTLDKKF